jgi:hypothetical protein
MDSNYSAAETLGLLAAIRRGEAPDCPRCGLAMSRRSVEPRSDISYVRDRVWLVCGQCHGSAVIDRREIERKD